MQASYEDAEKGLAGVVSADMARGFVETYRALNEGRMRPLEPRRRANTTTSMEEFLRALRAGDQLKEGTGGAPLRAPPCRGFTPSWASCVLRSEERRVGKEC